MPGYPQWCCCGASTPTAPCCLPDGTCEIRTEASCDADNGDWYADSKSCDDENVDCESFTDPDTDQCICSEEDDPTPVNNVIVQINFDACEPITCSTCSSGTCPDAFSTYGTYGRSKGLWILHPITPTSPNFCTYCDQRGPDDDTTNGVVDLGAPWTCPHFDLVDGTQHCVPGGRASAVGVTVTVDETNHQLGLTILDGLFSYGTTCCTKLSGLSIITSYTTYTREQVKTLVSPTIYSLNDTEWANWCAGSTYSVEITFGSCVAAAGPDFCCADAPVSGLQNTIATHIDGSITVTIQRGY